MTNNEAGRNKTEELQQRAEKIISLAQEDFRKFPAADIQKLIEELSLRVSHLETIAAQFRQTEAELGESRKQCGELFDFAPVGYIILDTRGIVTNANFTASHMLGIPREKILNTPFINSIESQYRDAFRTYLEDISRTGQITSTEVEIRKGDGSLFFAQLQSVVLYERTSTNYRISVADITDRKRIEKALAESEEKYRELAEFFPEPVFEVDVRGKVTYANQKALGAFTLSTEDMRKGINIFDLIAPSDKATASKNFAKILEQGDIGSNEYAMIRRDGSPFSSLTHTARIMREGKVVGVRGTLLDISERKKTEMTLKESERRFRSTLDNMLEGCQIIDFNWRYAYVNEAVARQGKRTREELIGRTMMEMYPGIENTELFGKLKRCMQDRVPIQVDNNFTFPDGTSSWFELRIEPVPEGILILSLDITSQKLAKAT